ncbi:MAG: hypothetical protein L0206_17965 [Actinobacteria bacterium]|nr:hypothetical protein [Actinomycetota bacterium]
MIWNTRYWIDALSGGPPSEPPLPSDPLPSGPPVVVPPVSSDVVVDADPPVESDPLVDSVVLSAPGLDGPHATSAWHKVHGSARRERARDGEIGEAELRIIEEASPTTAGLGILPAA